jgi:probable rRNA maturation factor
MVVTDNRQVQVDLPPELVRRVEEAIEATLTAEGVGGEVSLSFVDDEEIAVLNRAWRKVEGPTDVLSFPLEDPELLGDVVISAERAKDQSERFGHSLLRELAFLAVHGTLHLLGYDDDSEEGERRMAERAEAVLGRLGISR